MTALNKTMNENKQKSRKTNSDRKLAVFTYCIKPTQARTTTHLNVKTPHIFPHYLTNGMIFAKSY
jgi:hypothetical protein